MKLVLSLFLTSLATNVMGQMLLAPSHTFNVTSPVTNGPYVAGQILPCTYRLFSTVDTSGLDLYIILQITDAIPVSTPIPSNSNTNSTSSSSMNPANNNNNVLGNNGTYVISEKADVSKTDAFLKQEGNVTFYEHSINFNIPTTARPGNYKVNILDRSTNTNLPIPIEIRPAAPSASPVNGISPSGSSSSYPSGSIFSNHASMNYSIPSYSMMMIFMMMMIMFYLS